MKISYVGERIESLERKASQSNSGRDLTVGRARDSRRIFSFLNPKDLDILYLYYISNKKQKEIQEIIQRNQPSICYDIKQIKRRLKFILFLQTRFDVFVDFIEHRAPEHFTSQEIEIMTLVYYTSSFTITAEVIGIAQGRVRYSFERCLATLHEVGHYDIYEIFNIIGNNLNIIKRVYRSKKSAGHNSKLKILLPV